MRARFWVTLSAVVCCHCGLSEFDAASNQARIHGGSSSNVPVVQFVYTTNDQNTVAGNGVVVGPHHIATATAVFGSHQQIFDETATDWSISNQPEISYVIRLPRLENETVHWDGPVAVVVTAGKPLAKPVILSERSPLPVESDASFCSFDIVGFGENNARKKARYCQVGREFILTDRYLNGIAGYYFAHGSDLLVGLKDAIYEMSAKYEASEQLFITHPSAFHTDELEYNGSACPADLGSPIVDYMDDTVVEDDVLVGFYLGDVNLDGALGLPDLPSCESDARYSVARGESILAASSPIPSATFIRRAVANCTAETTVEECKARILCDESQGDYKLEGDLCRPSCGKLADLRRTLLDEALMAQGKDPAAVPDSCALWCEKDNPELPPVALPWWSTPIELRPSHDCTRCLYYPPGNQPYSSDRWICPPNPPDEP